MRSGSCRFFVYAFFDFLNSSSYGAIYISLESHFHVEYNASYIVKIGSVVMEILTFYSWDTHISGEYRGVILQNIPEGFPRRFHNIIPRLEHISDKGTRRHSQLSYTFSL